MKLISVEISNIGKIDHIVFEINKPLIIFFGEPLQGKTTILNSIKFAVARTFPDDILKHGTDEGFIKLTFSNGLIKRRFKKSEDGTIKSPKIQCVIDGDPKDKPTEVIKELVNPFLLDQDFFVKKSGLERQRYFLELLDINTDDYKKRIKEIDLKASDLRSEIKGYGEIDVTPVEKIDVDALKEEKKRIENVYELERMAINQKNAEIQKGNEQFEKNIKDYEENIAKIEDIKNQIEELKGKIHAINQENDDLIFKRKNLFKQSFIDPLQKPDTSEIDERIAQAYAQEVRRDQYIKNMLKVKEREDKKKKLAALEQQKKDEEKTMLQELVKITNYSGIPGLGFDENAQATFEDTALDMLSNSQQMRLSSLLSDKYPEGFGVELIDKGESLGKSIYGFIEKAKREDKAILATVVGEKPAQVPEDVGVWVVEEGALR